MTAAALPRAILVVDDEPDLAELAQALLIHHGMAAYVAHSAAQALALLQAHPDIDALFSDVMMPGTTGLELADAVSALYPHIRIVLTSGFAAPKVLVDSSVRHAYIAKPYRIDDVVALLRAGPV